MSVLERESSVGVCRETCCAVHPFFALVTRELWAVDPSKSPASRKANATSGAQSEFRR